VTDIESGSDGANEAPASSGPKPRIVIADDHPVVREGLQRSLESFGIDVVDSVADGRGAVAAVEKLNPDAVIMYISMPAMDGVRATEIIRARHRDVIIVTLTFHVDPAIHRRALEAGATLVLTKDTPAEDVVSVLLEMLAREPLRDPSAKARPNSRPDISGDQATELTLSPREVEILALITRGASTTRIASDLYISIKTVKNHLASIYEKLDVTDRTQAVLTALRLGLVSLDD
jgi:DNA-binding NarL/FixJ family response regulator